MEVLLPSEIARLVLGYLEEEKCGDAYTNFLQSSEHLKECFEFSKRGRKVPTKVTGKTLMNILDDYCKTYCIIQEQLKKMGRSDDNEPEMVNLSEQLQLLFESMESTSPTQTMLFRVTLPSSSGRSNRVQSKSVRNDRGKRAIAHVEIDNGNEVSDENCNEWSCEDNIDNCNDALDVNTTPLESLPGNEGSPPVLKNRRKSITVHLEKNIDSPEKCLDFNVVQKAFLDNTELHEKIAQNINKVINTPEVTILQNEIHNAGIDLLNTGPGIDKELNSIIKTIVKETENDPAFEKLINGIVVENQEVSEDSDSRLNSWSESSTPQRPSSIPRDNVLQRRRIQNTVRSLPDLRKGQKRTEFTLKNRSRYLKRSSTELRKQFDTMSKIDDQNEEAIQSIIQVTQNANTKDNSQKTHQSTSEITETLIRPENKKIISMEGTIENVPMSTCQQNVSTEHKQLSINTLSPSKCIMTSSANKPITSVSCPDYVVVTPNPENFTVTSSSSNYQILPSALNTAHNVPQTYIFNQENSATPSTNVAQNIIVVQPQYSQITSSSSNTSSSAQSFTINPNNQDIMQMPIVMYADSVDSSSTIQATMPNIEKKVPSTKNTNTQLKYRPILPNYHQPIITVHPYFEPVKEQIPIVVEQIQPATITLPPTVNLIQTVQPLNVSATVEDSKSCTSKPTENEQPTPAVVKSLQTEDNTIQQSKENQENMQTESKGDVVPTVTPTETMKSNRLSLSTPRSGRSHIRALDFSTPTKSGTQRKALTSPKSKTQNQSSISIAKDARLSLFKCDDKLEPIPESASLFRRNDSPSPPSSKNIGIATRTPTVKPIADWDQVDAMFQSKSPTTDVSKTKRNRSFSESDASPQKIEKTETIQKKPMAGAWDADIRSLVSAVDINITKSVSINRKRVRRRGKLNTSKTKISPVKKRIKRESSTTSKTIIPQNNKTPPPPPPPLEIIENKRVTRSSNKKDISTVPILPTTTIRRGRKKIDKTQNTETISKTETVTSEPVSTSTNNDFWINKNQPTKYKQKCNPTNVILEEVVEPIMIETIENTIILQDSTDIVSKITPPGSTQIKSIKITNKSKETSSQPLVPIAVTRSLQPYLETPVKEDFCGIPITPRLMSPTSIAETPITKLLNEKTETMDPALMPTPGGLSLTPLLAITPKIHDNYSSPLSYQSRPTDYSSCSSYYVPCEDQHNELEALILNDFKKSNNDTEKPNSVSVAVQNTEAPGSSSKPSANNDESSSDSSCSSNNTSSSDSSCSSSSSSDTTSKSEREDITVIDNTKKIVESRKNLDDSVEREDERKKKEYERISVELNEKRLRTIIKFKQDALTSSKTAKSNKLPKNNVTAKKLPRRKSNTPKQVSNTSSKKLTKTTLAKLLAVTKPRRSRSKLKPSNNSRLKISLNDSTNNDNDFPALHISEDEEKSPTKGNEPSKPSVSAIDHYIQESDTESAIALVTHLKERGILLVPNKKNKSFDSKTPPKSNDESKLLTENENPTKDNENPMKDNENPTKDNENSMKDDPNLKDNKNNDGLEEDCDREFSNVILDNQIEIIFDDNKSVQTDNNDSNLDLNSSFAKYEVEYVIDDVTRTFKVSPFYDLISMSPQPIPPKKRIIRRVTSKQKLQKVDESTIKTSSPKLKSSKRYVDFGDEESNDVDAFLSKCSPIPKEKTRSKESLKSNDYVDLKNFELDKNKKEVPSNFTLINEHKNVDIETNKTSNLNKNELLNEINEDIKVRKSENVTNEDKKIRQELNQKNKKLATDNSSKKNEEMDKSKSAKEENEKNKDKIRKKVDKKLKDDYEEGECTNSEDENVKAINEMADSKKNKSCKTEGTTIARKRKASSDTPMTSSDTKAHKKIKQNNPQKLLLNLDVDKFLTKVHGPTK
ncbi:serine-rich adhesin for platelets-like isoform X2 [Chrysoperla carnea]|uniref:serine-rich adhesin for platelets-like isoform X2 n=1 Tax=Chrysoperla carnea TaxID=189513 RepID=UPI001D071A1B|nr:serine-rich adhesin for platelets-like isoform X2 [Chrysoperla carnea]